MISEVEFLKSLRDDMNMQIRSYAPLEKAENDGLNNFCDSVRELQFFRNKINKRIKELKERLKKGNNLRY